MNKMNSDMGQQSEVIDTNDDRLPSAVADDYYIYASAPATLRTGKWVIFVAIETVDEWWAKIREWTRNGQLGPQAKVATARSNPVAKKRSKSVPKTHRLICVYTKDYADETDVMRVRKKLSELGINWQIGYKPDMATRACLYESGAYIFQK